jgi:O-antigen ligase
MLNWRWLGRQIEWLGLGLLVLYAVGVGGTLNGLVRVPLRALTLGLVFVLSGLWLLKSRQREDLPPFAPPLLGLWLATALTTAFSADPRRSLIYLGYIGAITLAYWALSDWVAADQKRLETALLVVIAILVAISLHELRLWLVKNGGQFTPPYIRPSSLMGSPNIYATLLVVAPPLVARRVLLASSWLWRGLLLVFLTLLGGLLILAGSRGAWLGAFLGGLLFVVLALAAYRLLSFAALRDRIQAASGTQKAGLALIAILVVIVVVVALPFVMTQATDSTHGSAPKRFAIWNAALWQFGRTPLFGRGPFLYGDAYLERISTPPETPHAHAHNLVLNVAAEGGLLGLLALVGLAWTAWTAIRDAMRSQDVSQRIGGAAAATLLVAVLAHNMFDFTLVPGITLLTLWSLTALLPSPAEGISRGGSRPYRMLRKAASTEAASFVRDSNTRAGVLTYTTLRRWAAPGVWLATLLILAYPLPAAQAAAQATAAAGRGDWATATEGYELAMRHDPALTIYRLDAAFANAQLALDGDQAALVRAIDHYREALAWRPEYAIHWANLAVLEVHAGLPDAALDDIEQAIRRAPNAPEFVMLRDIIARGGDLSTGDTPPMRGFGYDITYSLNRFHAYGPALYLFPLPDAEEAP